MGGILLAVKPEFRKGRIREVQGGLFTRGQIVKMNAVSPPGSRKPPDPIDRTGINGRVGMPVLLPSNGQPCPQGPLRSLIDPKLEQTKFVGGQVLGVDLVLGRRHDGIFQMGGNLEKKTVLRIARFNERTSVVSLSNVVGGFHNGIPLRTGPVMAGQAIGPEDGEYLLLKIDRFVSLYLGDLEFPPGAKGEENQKGERKKSA